MTLKLISINTAKLALEKGYPKNREYCDLAYKGEDGALYADVGEYTDYPAPTQALLQYWLRLRGVEVEVMRNPIYNTLHGKYYDYVIYKSNEEEYGTNEEYESYEEAMEAGLFHALNLLS